MNALPMKSYIAPVSPAGDLQMTIPEEIRKEYGLEGIKAIALLLEDGLVRLIPLRTTLEEARGAIPGHPHSLDFDDEIDAAIEVAIAEKYV